MQSIKHFVALLSFIKSNLTYLREWNQIFKHEAHQATAATLFLHSIICSFVLEYILKKYVELIVLYRFVQIDIARYILLILLLYINIYFVDAVLT